MYSLSKQQFKRTRPTKPFPYLSFRLSAEGSGEEPNKKLKRKWFWLGGRPKYEGDGAVEFVRTPQSARKSTRSVPLPILDFLQKKFGFHPKGTAILRFCRFWQNCEQSGSAKVALCAKRAEFERICHAPRGAKESSWFWIWKLVVLVWFEKFYQTAHEFCIRKTTNLFCFAFSETWKR